ncbi:MAG: GspE/PulE family protein [Puniceicoccales bacterium]|jgi:type II secretory ATPase GspE/PulE/Tfp pilus assembly ATPase PilB-like protein|nr:GspE/PulE family protein [Puniceicoccales bacterium]
MFCSQVIEKVNADLIKCLVDIKIIDAAFASELKNLEAEALNENLIETLQKAVHREKLFDAIGIEVLMENIPTDGNELDFIGRNFAASNALIPILLDDKNCIVAVADPFNVELMDTVSHRLKIPIAFKLTSFRRVKNFWETINARQKTKEKENVAPVSTDTGELESVSMDKFFDNLLRVSISERASDIHLEHCKDGMRIRIRVDGKLHTINNVDKIFAQAVIAKIKFKADAKIDEVHLPQDRRIRVKIFDKNYDLRISILPTIYGENVAIRIFDQEDNDFDLNNIGLNQEQSILMESIINGKSGLILLCGATGCGKTTTLYTILKKISSRDRKVITIEDPIEYRLDGISQVPVNDEIGLSFASILRSVLRQSPNVIMVGEIRDYETAELVIQATLTGHLVLSTIHCNDALGAITRLLDLGISEFLIKSCLRGSISQKLVRKPCQFCMTSRELSDTEKVLFPQLADSIETVPEVHGCENCSWRGYRGRIAIFDFLVKKSLTNNLSTASQEIVFDDFLHADSFSENITRLLKDHAIMVEDVSHLLVNDVRNGVRKFEHIKF